jgi:myo-inositol-1(or 4)-monophosphatase
MLIDLEAHLAVAQFAAAQAARALTANRKTFAAVEEDLGREIKIVGDKRAEDLILKTLRQFAPHPILTEETGWHDADQSEWAWAVDPLDGSVNYALGFPHCAVSIALLRSGKPILGVVDCFALGECFTGIVGMGATCNGSAIYVSTETQKSRATLMTGIPARAATDQAAMHTFAEEMAQWRKVRMIGSAAAALACVACGRGDAYAETGGMLWDVAGGCAVVEAAGGAVSIEGAQREGPLQVRAWNNAGKFFGAGATA